MNDLKPGSLYRHYKGKMYRIVGFARHSETCEEMVVYQALYESPEFGNNALWVRPKKMFAEFVVVNGQQTARFAYVSKSEDKCSQQE